MSPWRTPISCYVSPAGNNKIAEWYQALSSLERTDADVFLRNMRKSGDWSWPFYRPKLSGHRGLGELRWKSENKQHRLVGFFHQGKWCALIGCTHKQNIYAPADALDTAERRHREVKAGNVTTEDYDL